MDNVNAERRRRKRHRKRPRTISSSSDNMDRSISRSSSRRHKSKRRRRHSPEHIRSKEGTESRRKSKKHSSSKRSRSRTARTRNIPEQTNSILCPEPVQNQQNPQETFNASAPSTSIPVCEAIPSTSTAVSFLPVRTSTSAKQKVTSISTAVTLAAPGVKVPGQSGSSQSVNMKPKSRVDQKKPHSPPVEEHSESELQCSICSELFIKATMLNCIHTFCKYCIDMWKRNKAECPLCRTPITSECRITKFDIQIEKISSKTEESKKQRMDTLKEREEFEVNLSRQETQSSAQQRRHRTSSLDTTVQLLGVFDDSSSEGEREEDISSVNDNDDDDDDSVFNDNMILTDVDGEEDFVQYAFFTDTDEDGNDGVIGEEFYNTNSGSDDAGEDSDVYVIDDNHSDGNASVDNNDYESIDVDENFVYESSQENNDNGDGDIYEDNSDDENANEEDGDSGNSNDSVYIHEANDDNEDDSENNYEDNNSSHYTDDNIDNHLDYNENDDVDYYEEDNNDENIIDIHDYASDNNSNDVYENNDEYDSDAHYDDGDYDSD